MQKDYRAIIVLSLILLAVPWLAPNRYLLSVAVLIGIDVLMVIGLNLLLGYAGQISLGHAAFYGIGGYGVAILTVKCQWPPLAALPVALLLTAAVAWLIGKPTLRLQGHYLAMATLGFGMIVQILLGEMTDLTGGVQGISGIPKLNILGLSIQNDFAMYFVVWSFVMLVQLMVCHLVRGKVGRAFLAIHSNELAAESLGVNTARLKLAVFVISAVLAGLAGGLYACAINYLSPEPFGFGFSVLLVTMVIVGGMGSLWGPVLGAAILGILPELLRNFKDFDILIYGLLLMVIVIFLPQGTISLFRIKKSLNFKEDFAEGGDA